jgi:hypothetical protein
MYLGLSVKELYLELRESESHKTVFGVDPLSVLISFVCHWPHAFSWQAAGAVFLSAMV